MLKLIVVVPAYNEAERLRDTVESLRKVEGELQDLGCRLLVYVVNDGSQDATQEVAEQSEVERVIRHRVNQGLGAAIRSGLSAARSDDADIVVKFDADLQHDPSDIPNLVRPILEDEADLVYGNRFERIQYRMPFVRRTGNALFTRLMAWLTGWPLKDSQPGIFAAHRAYLHRFYLPGDYNYTQQILLDAYHKGMRFAHVPVTFRERTTGKSFISLRYPFKVVPQILLMLLLLKPLRVFVPVGLLFMALGTIVLGWDLVSWIRGETGDPVVHANAIIGFGLFGLQTVFFGLLGHLIIQQGRT